MERQLVAPSVDQWRAVRRSITTQETTYKPGPEFFGYRPRNRQLLHITSSEPNDQGFYPAKWVQSDVGDQTHNDQNDVWAWPVEGVASEDQYLEGDNVGELDGVPVFRGFVNSDGFSDIVRAVTNVCPIGETSGGLYVAADDYEISTSGGQAIVAGSFDADAGKVTVRGVVDWTDPDFAAGSGDSFGFYLKVNGENYTGAPVHLVTFVGSGAGMQKEMVWELALAQAGTLELALWAYRVAGSRSLTAASSSRIEVNGNAAGIKVEYRQIIVPPGSHIGPKVCVVNPTDCCIDDDSSTADTASRISVSCCSVPIPAMRMVDLSSAAIYQLPGWQSVGYGWGQVNFDETFTEIKDQLKKVHYLPYVGEFTDTRVRCVYEKEIPLDNLWASSRSGFSGEVRSQLLNHYIELRFVIAERQPGEQSPFNDLNIVNGQLVGPAPAAEYRAHCSLGIAVKVYSSANPSPQFNGGFGFFQPHTTNEFYASQPDGTYLWEKANTLPTAGTSCIGACNLLMFAGTPTGGWPGGLEPQPISPISLSPTLSVVPVG